MLRHGQRILRVALHAQVQRFNPLQQQERIERRERRAGVAQPLHARLQNERQRPKRLRVRKAVIRRIRLGELLESARSCPVELARIHDHAANRGAVAAQKLGCRVDHNVRSPLDGPHQRRRSRGIVDDQRQAVLVRNGGKLFDVDNVELGVAERLGIDGAGLVVDRRAQAVEVVRVDKADHDAQPRQRVVEEVVGSAVERGRGDDLVACRGQRGDGERLRRLA